MISYKPLFHYMIEHSISKKYLHEEVGIGWTTIAKLANNEPVRMDILEKICLHFHIPIEQVLEIQED